MADQKQWVLEAVNNRFAGVERFDLTTSRIVETKPFLLGTISRVNFKRRDGSDKTVYAYVPELDARSGKLRGGIELFENSDQLIPLVSIASTTLFAAAATPDLSKVFVVHGHDGEPREAVARFLERLGFEAIILHERPNKGRTIITKFREEAAGVGFAVVLMTPDDLGRAEKAHLQPRARQNVVFELGFFIGALGPERVAALVKGNVERPSDFDGVVYISLDDSDWQRRLGEELDAAGYGIDWNKVMRR